jgi:hypothetical protein
MRLVDAVADGLREAMRKHPGLVLMGQDIADYGGVFKVTEGFVEEFGRERVRNTPLCESAILGAGLGLSINGMKAMVEMQFADFRERGYHTNREQPRQITLALGAECRCGGADALWRRRGGRAVPLSKQRGVVLPHARPQGGLSGIPIGCEGSAHQRIRGSESLSSSSSRRHCTGACEKMCLRDTTT